MYKNSMVHYLTKISVDILFYGGIVCCVAVPYIIKWWIKYFNYGEEFMLPMTVILMSSGILSVYILYQLKMIFRTLIGGNPFVEKNVMCLRKISVASFVIAIIYLVKCIFWFTISTAVIVAIFGIACLFCLTLKDVFKQALHYKEENDLTV